MNAERLEALQRLAQEKPEDSRLQFGLAVELLNRGDVKEGVEALRAYLARGEDEGNGWGRLGAALAELGKVEEARRAYRRGIEIAAGRGHSALAEEFSEAMEGLP